MKLAAVMILLALVGTGFSHRGHPKATMEDKNLAVLQRYLERAVHEMAAPSKYRRVEEPQRRNTVDDVITFIDNDMDPAEVDELARPIADLTTDDLPAVADQALAVINAYFTDAGAVNPPCVDMVAVLGSLELSIVSSMIPIRIALVSAVTRVLLTATDGFQVVEKAPERVQTPLEEVMEDMKEALENILAAMGLPDDTDITSIATSIGKAIKTIETTTTGKEILAALISGVVAVTDAVGDQTLDAANCDAAGVQAILAQLKTDITAIVNDATSLDAIQKVFPVTSDLAAVIQTTIAAILTPTAGHGILTAVVDAEPTGEGLAKVLITEIFELAMVAVEEEVAFQRLLAAAGGEMPDLEVSLYDATVSDVVKMSIAATSHMSAVFGFTCEKAKFASVIAGLIEKRRFNYNLINPATTKIQKMVMKVIEKADSSASSEEVRKDVSKELSRYFDGIFTEAILPLTNTIDADINDGIVYRARYLPIVLRAVFRVRFPETLHELLRIAVVATVNAFTEDNACSTEPTMEQMRDFLETALDSIENTAIAKLDELVGAIQTEFGLSSDAAGVLKTLLFNTVKILQVPLNTDLVVVQGELDVSPTLEGARTTLGALVGTQIYEEVWAVKVMTTLGKLLKAAKH